MLAPTYTHSCTVLENAWRVQDWTAMKEASTQAEPICSENYSARLNLLRGFLALCYPDEQRLSAVEKLIEAASIQGIKQWRRLPKIVSHAHVSLLQVNCGPCMYIHVLVNRSHANQTYRLLCPPNVSLSLAMLALASMPLRLPTYVGSLL